MTEITEASLRARMRDERYWNGNHPGAPAWRQSVTEGWRQLVEAQTGGGRVQVRAYDQTRNGQSVHVGAYERAEQSSTKMGREVASAPHIQTSPPEGPSSSRAAYRMTEQCVAQYQSDILTCNSATVRPAFKRQCYESAAQRRDACARGAYIPPLFLRH